MDQLAITEKDGANYHLYELEGALNAYTMGEFQNTLYEAVIFKNIVLDMSRLIELDPSGVGFLMAAFNDAEEYGHKLYFLSLSNEAEKAIAATGFKNEFHLIVDLIMKYNGDKKLHDDITMMIAKVGY